MNRDRWLANLADKLSPLFRAASHPLPPCILGTREIDGLSTAQFDRGNWLITISNAIDDKIEVAETLVNNLISRAIPLGETGGAALATTLGYRSYRPKGDKLMWGIRRLVESMPAYPPKMTRKAWLTRLVDELRPLFVEAGHPLPKIEASPGWVSPGYPHNGVYQLTTGECHVFIWPQLSRSLGAALAVVTQLARCAVDVFGPRERVAEVAAHIGLAPEPTPALNFLLKCIIADIGEYPEN